MFTQKLENILPYIFLSKAIARLCNQLTVVRTNQKETIAWFNQ